MKRISQVFFFMVFLCGVPSANALIISSSSEGWIDGRGRDNGGFAGNNTLTGMSGQVEGIARVRSWLLFDLSSISVPGDLLSASLNITTTGCCPYGTPPLTHTIAIYDLNGQPTGVSGFTDAGFGEFYGSFVATLGLEQTIDLGPALADIEDSFGGLFYMAFQNITREGQPTPRPFFGEGIYINGVGVQNDYVAPALHLVFEGSSVPSPASWILVLAGMVVLRLRSLRRPSANSNQQMLLPLEQ